MCVFVFLFYSHKSRLQRSLTLVCYQKNLNICLMCICLVSVVFLHFHSSSQNWHLTSHWAEQYMLRWREIKNYRGDGVPIKCINVAGMNHWTKNILTFDIKQIVPLYFLHYFWGSMPFTLLLLQDTLSKDRQRQLVSIQPIRILFLCCVYFTLIMKLSLCMAGQQSALSLVG